MVTRNRKPKARRPVSRKTGKNRARVGFILLFISIAIISCVGFLILSGRAEFFSKTKWFNSGDLKRESLILEDEKQYMGSADGSRNSDVGKSDRKNNIGAGEKRDPGEKRIIEYGKEDREYLDSLLKKK